MKVLYMARYYLKRMMRNRAAVIAAMAAPLVCGIGCVAAPGQSVSPLCRWICFLLCACVACGWVMLLREADKAWGVADALRNAPISKGQVVAARAMAGAVVFVLQASVIVALLAFAL